MRLEPQYTFSSSVCFAIIFKPSPTFRSFCGLGYGRAEVSFAYLSSFTDTEADNQGTPKKENNNSVYASDKSPSEKYSANGVLDTGNSSIGNTPDLSPVKNVRNGEVDDAEVRKTKVDAINHVPSLILRISCFFRSLQVTRFRFIFKQRWPTDKAYYIAKELLMTERTYKKDLDVINVVI